MSKILNAKQVVEFILKDRSDRTLNQDSLNSRSLSAQAFAPANIALVKYWGKRNGVLNLPMTSSLSLSLKHLGAETKVSVKSVKLDTQAETGLRHHQDNEDSDPQLDCDQIILNNQVQLPNSKFHKRLSQFLDLFRDPSMRFQIDTTLNIPVEAGLASSSAGFAALVLALDKLFAWQLDKSSLSILARLGSGSACRSFWPGFVEWQKGESESGMDSLGSPLQWTWPELRLGILIIADAPKAISSREAMESTLLTSPFYALWPKKVEQDLQAIKTAIQHHNFSLLGEVTEQNALAMHALMMTAFPPIIYAEPSTLAFQKKIWALRKKGLLIYFTSDAGPNLKLLFLAKDYDTVCNEFENLTVIDPF